ncbi:MAG: 5'-nucleotidase C-terminal domain-containing protein [Treponema sp.]|nr:5'-nucleotidase C-terminal domain-containing protein [Treponema sp.]
MKKNHFAVYCIGMLCAGAALFTGCAKKAPDETRVITLLQTSDIHGMLYPFDYAVDRENRTSMAQVAAIVARERAVHPDLLLLDNGDISQANYIQEFRHDAVHPAIAALNLLAYDTWTLGNHEFNFEFDVLKKQINDFNGTVITGNIYKDDGSRWLDAYHIFDVGGIKVAVFGITAPHVPQWEKADASHYDYMTFTTPLYETERILKELQGKADVIVGNAHYGLDGEYGTDGMRTVAERFGSRMDGLFVGHAHQSIDDVIGGIPVLEPANNARFVAKLSIVMERYGNRWTVNRAQTKGELLDCAEVAPDADFLAAFQTVHEQSRAMASRQIGWVGETFLEPRDVLPGIPRAIVEDNPIIDLINTVQMHYVDVDGDGVGGDADVSLAALFNAASNLERGPFLHRDSVKIYQYDNTLFGVRITGAQLKAIMEAHAGNFFNQYVPGDVTISFNPDIRMYNYDEFAGVDYEIDISKPVGERIVNVRYKGAPLDDSQQLVLAVNNYRYGGLVTAGLIREEQVVYEGGAIRDMITEYVQQLDGALMPQCDNNWRIIGAPLNDPQKELLYAMVRSGELAVPTSADGRTPNVASLNGPALRAAGILPAFNVE